MSFYTYIAIAHRDGRTYVGSSSDPTKRVAEHGGSKGAKALRGTTATLLWVSGPLPTRGEALRLEAALKSLSRPLRLALVSGTAYPAEP